MEKTFDRGWNDIKIEVIEVSPIYGHALDFRIDTYLW